MSHSLVVAFALAFLPAHEQGAVDVGNPRDGSLLLDALLKDADSPELALADVRNAIGASGDQGETNAPAAVNPNCLWLFGSESPELESALAQLRLDWGVGKIGDAFLFPTPGLRPRSGLRRPPMTGNGSPTPQSLARGAMGLPDLQNLPSNQTLFGEGDFGGLSHGAETSLFSVAYGRSTSLSMLIPVTSAATAVPEPASAALWTVVIALALFGVQRRKTRQKR